MKYIFLFLLIPFLSQASFGDHDVEELRFRESVTNTAHKYYLSVSNVKYNSKGGALQMTSRFFIDDLEDVLSARADKSVVLTEKGSLEIHKSLIGDYFKSRLRVKVDGELILIEYLGAEVENDQLVLYIEIPVNQEPSEIEMRFTALMELFEDQKNMVHLKIKGERKTLLMIAKKKIDSVKF
ncbi:hypothetical protein JCM19297_3226 [Nonlabens ulvanivorans]|nr:DUF6702 family protein [Nonlabens ulvanivorans]GAK88713.1 hypothetical protein JCM19297_3226 [Nonlabens ulvanivorans]